MYPERFVAFASFAGLLFVPALILLLGCESFHRNKSHASAPLASIKQGKALAQTYCRSCHALPDPALLDATSWEKGVLPDMGQRLGIFQHDSTDASGSNGMWLPPDFYPTVPVITEEQWQHIRNYYTATSPDTLPQQQRVQPIQMNLSLFDVQTPALQTSGAMTSFLKINERDTAQPVLLCDAAVKKIFFLNKELQPVDSIPIGGTVADMQLFQNTMLVCNIGVLHPNNGRHGKATYISRNDTGTWRQEAGYLFENLQRPVQISDADLNGDGQTDFLICEFGYRTGSLCWMEAKGSGNYQRHVLRPLAGATKAYIQDYNRDGRPDIWVLFGQGEEGIFLYTNQGGGKFSEEQVLRFPSVYGSSYFELADFNGDGYPDIVYTCGDNADYSPVLKPYHGVYIFINDKKNGFKQKFFFPMHGCYKAMARDFDQDGDLDIAAISYFADYARQPEEGFVYLENDGNFQFQPYSTEAAKWGRWLTMDAGDVDGDGWTDLVLGNFSLVPTISKSAYDWRQGPPAILLKNKGKK